MKKIYLKENLKSFKEFTLLNEEIEIESADTGTTPTQDTSKNIEGDSITGDNISGEIDTILDKLKELEDGIEENIDSIISEVFTEDTQLNEAAGATLMAMFRSGASLAKLHAMYPKLYKKKKKAALDKTLYGYKFDASKEEKIEAAMDKAKDALNKQIAKLDDPAAKKKARLTRDTKLEGLKKQIGVKLDRAKTDQATKQDRSIADLGDKISKLMGKHKIDSPMISAEWEKSKIKIERNLDDEFLKKERALQDEFIEDPERLKRLEKAAQERVDKEIKEEAEKSKKAEEQAKAAQAKLDEEIANASEDEKEALGKIKAYMTGISAFGAATGAAASDPENKDLYKEAKTKLSELKKAYTDIGDSDYAKAFGYEGNSKESDISAAKLEYKERIETMEEPFDKIRDTDDTDDTDDADDKVQQGQPEGEGEPDAKTEDEGEVTNDQKLANAKEDFKKKVADKEKEGWKKGEKPDDEHDQTYIKEPTGIDDGDGELFYSNPGFAMHKKKEEK